MVLAILCALSSLTLLVYYLTTLSEPSKTGSTTSANIHVLASSDQNDGARTVAQHYMEALMQGRYATMWSLLHADVRAMWPSQDAFATFWKKRFQGYLLQHFTVGNVSPMATWVNPETIVTYNNVQRMPVSLQLSPTNPSTQLPPENQHPSNLFQNVPFIVEHENTQGMPQGQWVVLSAGPADIEAPILPPLTPVDTTVQVPIPMYHHISNAPTPTALDKSLTVTPADFAKQMDHLKAQGYHSITFNQLFSALYYGGPLPEKPILLTFDDGYDDAYKFAYPILKAHGFSGMFYIISGKVGWDGQMSWAQMREMLANGMQMGSHTVHHVDMGETLQSSQEQAQQELQDSQMTLQKNLGVAIQQFCYPSGEPFRHGTVALQRAIVALLVQDGYIGATTDPGKTGVDQSSQAPMELLRLRIDGRNSLLTFTSNFP